MEYLEYKQYCKSVKELMFSMLSSGKSGHIGGSLSITESLVVVYNECIKGTNNKLIYSKGHCELALYALFIKEHIIDELWLDYYKQFGSVLQGHPDIHKINELNFSAGSLGQGLSFAIGMALCGKKDDYEVYVILGDGELQEGQIWEGAMLAPWLKLGNLNVLIDCNGFQLEGEVPQKSEGINAAWSSFGWNAVTIQNGHDIHELKSIILKKEKNVQIPNVYFIKTVKGHGISFMENRCEYHGKSLSKEEIYKALLEIREK